PGPAPGRDRRRQGRGLARAGEAGAAPAGSAVRPDLPGGPEMSTFFICPDCAYSVVPCARHAQPIAVAPAPQPQMGWTCPGCGASHSPYVTTCPCRTPYSTTVISGDVVVKCK